MFDLFRRINQFPGPVLPLCNTNPQPWGTAAPGTSPFASRCDHVHPEPEAVNWTPEITFSTPGNLSVSYVLQSGAYTIITTNLAFIWAQVVYTPTYTTASGVIRITGLPFTGRNNGTLLTFDCVSNAVTWPAGQTQAVARLTAGQSYVEIVGFGTSPTNRSLWTTAQSPTAVQRNWLFSGLVGINP